MARRSRQLVLMGPEQKGAAAALGRLAEVRATLARFNTASDGSPPGPGIERLHGPGFVVELPTSVEPVMQAIASVNDEDTAFPVLLKMCKTLGWRMMDIDSGRVLG